MCNSLRFCSRVALVRLTRSQSIRPHPHLPHCLRPRAHTFNSLRCPLTCSNCLWARRQQEHCHPPQRTITTRPLPSIASRSTISHISPSSTMPRCTHVAVRSCNSSSSNCRYSSSNSNTNWRSKSCPFSFLWFSSRHWRIPRFRQARK